MFRLSRAAGVGVVAVVASAGAAGAAGAAGHPELVGVVGQNNAFKISLTLGGKKVTSLKAGTYAVVIHDDSKMHNFELDGPNGKSWTFTQVPFVGTKTFTLKLTAGAYKAYCAPHESMMFQHFTVK